MTEQTQPIVSTLRVRTGQEEAHYGGNLVEGARVLKFFGDIVTEVAIITDGDEGLFVGYDKVEFLAPVYTGDFLEVTGTVTRDRKSTRLNSSHANISYAVFCLKKKIIIKTRST